MRKWLAYWYYDRKLRFVGYRIHYAVLGCLFFWHKPKVKFILFSQGRSGSTLLSDLLDSSPLVKSDEEVFGAGMPLRVWLPNLYLHQRMRSFRSEVYGCKIKVYDLQKQHNLTLDETRNFLRNRFEEGWKIIHLRRTNKLRQALSSLVAEERKEYHQFSPTEIQPKVHVDVSQIPDRLYWLHEFDRWEDEILDGFDRLEVNYESDLEAGDGHQELLDRLMDYLGLPHCEAFTRYEKTSTTKLHDYIENYEELVRVVKESGNERYLTSP